MKIHKIAVDRNDLGYVAKIKERIVSLLGITPKKLTWILKNRAEATNAELIAIASILSEYEPTSPEDLITK